MRLRYLLSAGEHWIKKHVEESRSWMAHIPPGSPDRPQEGVALASQETCLFFSNEGTDDSFYRLPWDRREKVDKQSGRTAVTLFLAETRN